MTTLERKDDQFRGDLGKAVSLDLKVLTDDGEFEGYASTFGNVDRGDDICMAGCFSDTLVRYPAPKVKMLWQHRTDKIIGKWLELREDNRGLYAKGKLFTNLEQGREVYELMKEGALDGMSIGFRTLVDEYDRELHVRRLMKVELREISVVTFPMNDQATVSLVKAGQIPTEREFEQFLVRDAGFSAQQAKAIISRGFKSLSTMRDAGTGDETGLMEAIQELRGTFAS